MITSTVRLSASYIILQNRARRARQGKVLRVVTEVRVLYYSEQQFVASHMGSQINQCVHLHIYFALHLVHILL